MFRKLHVRSATDVSGRNLAAGAQALRECFAAINHSLLMMRAKREAMVYRELVLCTLSTVQLQAGVISQVEHRS